MMKVCISFNQILAISVHFSCFQSHFHQSFLIDTPSKHFEATAVAIFVYCYYGYNTLHHSLFLH